MSITENQNLIPNEPKLADLLDLLKKDILKSLSCHHVGTVQEFNATKQTAKVTINYKRTFYRPSSTGGYAPVLEDYPVLLDCPVVCLGGGNGVLTFPIAKGDECLVLFNDRDLDNWFNGSTTSGVATPRMHNFSDAIVLVGLRSLATKITSYITGRTELRSKDGVTKLSFDDESIHIKRGDNKVEVTEEKITATIGENITLEINEDGKLKITNATTEFVAALNQLFTDIQNAVTVTMLGSQPLVMPTFTTDLAAFQTFKE